ncbi:hypothetical protein ACHAWF_002404 [Thalassiosira exigua]
MTRYRRCTTFSTSRYCSSTGGRTRCSSRRGRSRSRTRSHHRDAEVAPKSTQTRSTARLTTLIPLRKRTLCPPSHSDSGHVGGSSWQQLYCVWLPRAPYDSPLGATAST